MSKEPKLFNPLKAVWNVISTISGAVGLVSFADSFYAWNEVFDQMITVYRSIVHWPFQWVPFEIANWVKDYIFIGSVITGSFIKTMNYSFKEGKPVPSTGALLFKWEYQKLNLLFISTWPLIIPGVLIFAFAPIFTGKKTHESRMFMRILSWILVVVLIFVCAIIASITLNR